MEDLSRRVKHVLAVYLERGERAVQALTDRKYDEAREILLLRNAAFHNLRAVDALAQGEGLDAAQDPETLAIWDRTRQVDKRLAEALTVAKDETERLHQRLREARQKIGKYRAGTTDAGTFTKTA